MKKDLTQFLVFLICASASTAAFAASPYIILGTGVGNLFLGGVEMVFPLSNTLADAVPVSSGRHPELVEGSPSWLNALANAVPGGSGISPSWLNGSIFARATAGYDNRNSASLCNVELKGGIYGFPFWQVDVFTGIEFSAGGTRYYTGFGTGFSAYWLFADIGTYYSINNGAYDYKLQVGIRAGIDETAALWNGLFGGKPSLVLQAETTATNLTNFGPGSDACMTLTIRNTGKGAATNVVTSITEVTNLRGLYGRGPIAFTLAPGEAKNIPITLTASDSFQRGTAVIEVVCKDEGTGIEGNPVRLTVTVP